MALFNLIVTVFSNYVVVSVFRYSGIGAWVCTTFLYPFYFWHICYWIRRRVARIHELRRKTWAVCYFGLAAPFYPQFAMGILEISKGSCSPFLMNFMICITLINTPWLVGIIFLLLHGFCALVRSCCKNDHNQNVLQEGNQPFSSEYQPFPPEYQALDPQQASQGEIDMYYTEIIVEENKEDEQCPICWDNFEKNQQLMKIQACQHNFHRNCLSQWTQRNQSCPVCRARILQLPMQIAPV